QVVWVSPTIECSRPLEHNNPIQRTGMSLTPTQRKTREWPLLVLALAIVCAVTVPLWQWTSANQPGGGESWARWTPEHLSRLLLGPEHIACYCCCTWAGFILLGRSLEVRRQRQALGLG